MESDFVAAFTKDRYGPSPEPKGGVTSSLFELRLNLSYCDLLDILRHCLHVTTLKQNQLKPTSTLASI
jgi:hypothetical protein